MSGMSVNSQIKIEKFRQINGPLVDTRSPNEFIKGHFPGAINIPLFNNKERAEIGTLYKNQGREEAIILGLKLSSHKLKNLGCELKSLINQAKIDSQFSNSLGLRLYCARGGMRSTSVAWLANLFDLKPVVLNGGYKSYRNWVLNQFKINWPLRLIGGRTGSGKTDLLLEMNKQGISTIDLEGLAFHRGSSFGGLGLPDQPTTEQYENLIAENLQNALKKSAKEIWLEAESSRIGRCNIPHQFFIQMKNAPVLEITRTTQERIDKLISVYSPNGVDALKDATIRISKRLGPQRTKEALEALEKENWESACSSILDYYDRCYDRELSRRTCRSTVDISGLKPREAATKIIETNLPSQVKS